MNSFDIDKFNELYSNKIADFKVALLELIEEYNKKNNLYKITYWEIYNSSYVLYIEDITNEIEYQSENYFDIKLLSCKTKEDFKRIILEVLERDLESESE